MRRPEARMDRVYKRPAKERLGLGFVSTPANALGLHSSLKWQRQENIREGNSFNEDKLRSSEQQKAFQKSSKNALDAIETQKKAMGILRTTNISAGESKDRSKPLSILTKKPHVQLVATPSTENKKAIVAKVSPLAVFLQRLGLSKYHVNFQAEEVDMFAFRLMNDNDLKSIGLPMGPRKKILLAIAALKARK